MELQIEPVISSAFFAHFNQRIIEGTLSTVETELARLLRQAVARMAMAQAGIEMSIRFSGNGFTIVDQLKDQPEDGRKDATDKRLAAWSSEMNRTADAYLTLVKNHLLKYQDDPAFSIFKASDANPKEAALKGYDNGKRTGIFIA